MLLSDQRGDKLVMTPDSLKDLLTPLMNRQLLMEMAVKARQQAQPDATQRVVGLIQDL